MAVRVAAALWFVLAVVVWNVVFDRVLVVAGRQYVHAATLASRGSDPFLRIDDWMRPAITRAFRSASAAAGTVLAAGLGLIAVAAPRRPEDEP
jgi:hypothetical protein